jgi:hypothetical protein
MATEPTVEAYIAKMVERKITDISTALHDLAREIERQTASVERVGTPGVPNYSTIARSIHQKVMSALPQLGVDVLIDHAATADIARAKGE